MAFSAGRLSWSQVRAITRVATSDDEQTFVDLARHTTAAQLERVVRGVRRVQRIQEAEADPELVAHKMTATMRYDADGNYVLTIRGPADEAAVIKAAIEQVRADLDRRADESSAEDSIPTSTADPAARPVPATTAEAVLEMSRLVLEELSVKSPHSARRHRAALQVKVDPLSGWARLRDGELLPPPSLAKVLMMLPGRARHRLRPVMPTDLTRTDQGRTSRHAGQALRDLLGTVDGERCRFPGCTRHRRLHAHHVVFWSNGGRTDLANLVLVCSRHHAVIHRQGFQLELDSDRRLHVRTRDGVAVLHHPGLPWDIRGIDIAVDADTLPPDSIEARMDLGYVVSVVMEQAA